MLLCYLFAIAILIAFAVAMLEAPDVDDALGFQTLAALLFADLAVVFLHTAGLAQRPFTLHINAAISRCAMFIAGKQDWFIGVAFNYALFAGLLVTHIVDRNNPIVSNEEAVERAVGGLEAVLARAAPMGGAGGSGPVVASPIMGGGGSAVAASGESEKQRKDVRGREGRGEGGGRLCCSRSIGRS